MNNLTMYDYVFMKDGNNGIWNILEEEGYKVEDIKAIYKRHLPRNGNRIYYALPGDIVIYALDKPDPNTGQSLIKTVYDFDDAYGHLLMIYTMTWLKED